ncbi:hypothetical protein CLOM_g14968 [Closterium sp. NIES-68]|nr:hypothetical protein CLOM_g14968 [Closterium sp. NIES-68]GJP74221.1 hypothetical protein CLOP_g4843 [Closterium sp. NIES-67]
MSSLSAQLSRTVVPSLKSDLLRHEPVTSKRAVASAPYRRRFARSSRTLVAVAQSSQSSPTSLRDQADANAAAAIVTSVGPSDTFVQSLVAKFSLPAPSDAAFPAAAALGQLRNVSSEAARVLRWPGRKDEEFRFTDLKSLRALLDKALGEGAAAGLESQVVSADALAEYTLEEAKNSRIVVFDGAIRPELSDLTGIPAGITVKLLSQLNEAEVERFVVPNLGRFSAQADLFAALNGASAADVLVIAVPSNVKLPNRPIHIVYAASAASPALASPRLLVVAEAGAEVEVVEEFVGGGSAGGGKGEWMNAVAEIVIGAEGSVSHAVIQNQPAKDCFNIKRTFVAQEESSRYSLVEAQLGAALSRHNLKMQQLGRQTETNVDTFALAGGRQVQDLHSSLVLDFPGGVTRQLHKCIVSDATGQCVFDGNVKVNKLAQQTDAGQLSRSLLLVPRGTINVKPNLQIIADDVKCTHGAAISDLDDEQLFYFRTRGIDQNTARSALVFSFAAEVVDKLPYSGLRKRVEETVKKALSAQGAMEASVAADLQGATS